MLPVSDSEAPARFTDSTALHEATARWDTAPYRGGAVVILGIAGIRSQPVGVALWPAVVLHTAMTVWCITSLLRKPAQIVEKVK